MNQPSKTSDAIIILGMHRSGTSALAGLISRLGCDVGSILVPPAEGVNPKGFWEHAEIVDIHEKVLRALDSSWEDIRPLPHQWWVSSNVSIYKSMILKVLRRDFSSSLRWVIKDPRLCRLLPLWLDIFREFGCEPHFIITLRNPMEVAQSLSARDNFFEEQSSLLWLNHILHAEKWSRGFPRTFITYDRLLNDWRAEAVRISSELLLPLKIGNDEVFSDVDDFIDPSLRHYAKSASARIEANKIVLMAMQCYQMLEWGGGAQKNIEELDNMLLEVIEIAELITPWDRESRELMKAKNELRGMLALSEAEIKRVKNTWSWRLTKPFRFVYNRFSRLYNW